MFFHLNHIREMNGCQYMSIFNDGYRMDALTNKVLGNYMFFKIHIIVAIHWNISISRRSTGKCYIAKNWPNICNIILIDFMYLCEYHSLLK